MTRTLVACSGAALAIALGVVPGIAQTEAQDRCKDVLARQVFSSPEVKQDTFYWLARFSADVAQKSDGLVATLVDLFKQLLAGLGLHI